MIKPKKLKKGDTIAILSISGGLGGVFPYRIDRAKDYLEKIGFKVKEYPTARNNHNGKAGTIEERVKDIHYAFLDKDVKAIIAVIGGLAANEILDSLDYNIIGENPKIFCGYSDNNLFCYALYKKANMVSFYGPCILTQFGEYPEPLEYTIKYFMKALADSKPIGKIEPSQFWTDELLDWGKKEDCMRARKLKKNLGHVWINKGKATAPIVGGCLYSIHQLRGTEYGVDYTDKILFIEIAEGQDFRKGEPIDYVDSKLQDLENSGIFKDIKGLIIGRGTRYTPKQLVKFEQVIRNHFEKYDFPVLFNVDVGHTDPLITIPIGVKVTLDAYENLFSIDEPGVID